MISMLCFNVLRGQRVQVQIDPDQGFPLEALSQSKAEIERLGAKAMIDNVDDADAAFQSPVHFPAVHDAVTDLPGERHPLSPPDRLYCAHSPIVDPKDPGRGHERGSRSCARRPRSWGNG
jgi:hypothetical protein